MPHLSLLYGEVGEAGRASAIEAVGGPRAYEGRSLPVGGVSIVDCRGPSTHWKRLLFVPCARGRVALLDRDQLNTCSRAGFAQQVSLLFEPCPELTERLYARRPFASHSALIDEAEKILCQEALPRSEKVAILAAHPAIGAHDAVLSEASRREQSRTATAPATLARLKELNAAYGR